MTPKAAFNSLAKAKPTGPKLTDLAGQFMLRKDKVDKNGKVTLRCRGKLLLVGMGLANRARRVIMLVDGCAVRMIDDNENC